MILVEDFHKAYGKTIAVEGLSFRVEHGQILGLVGHNGAGKTTTLRALCGILASSRGRMEINGHDLAATPIAAKRSIGYIPDDPQLFDALTVAEHLEFFAAAYRIERHEERAEALLDYFQLTSKAHTLADELSRGMRQKLAVCCAYLHEPAAIIFDEPLTGLDPLAIRRLKQSITERARSGSAVIVSSHLLAMVEDVCTHFLFLENGKAKFFGARRDLHHEFGGSDDERSLEEIFFLATEASQAAMSSAVPVAGC